MLAGEDELPFPCMSPPGVHELTEEAQHLQSSLKQDAADAMEEGDIQLALNKISEAIALGCASALMYSRRAQLLLKLGRLKAAVRDCTAALKINPDSGKAFKIRGRCYAKLQHWFKAHADFQEGLKIDYDEETYEDSLEAAERAREIQAGDQVADGDGSDTADEQPFPPRSPPDIIDLTEEGRAQQNEQKALADEALEDGDDQLALEKYSEAIALGCATALMYSRRAQLLLTSGRPRAAINDCDAALEINADSAKAFKIRAKAHVELGHWIKAASDFREGLSIDYDEATNEKMLAITDKIKQALKDSETQKAREAHPAGPAEINGPNSEDKVQGVDDTVGQGDEPPFPAMGPKSPGDLSEDIQLQVIGLKQDAADALEDGDPQMAMESYTEAIVLGGGSALMYSRRAEVLLQLGRPRAALHDCNAALCLNDQSTRALKFRARAFACLQDWVRAHVDYEKCLLLDPDDETREEASAVMEKAQKMQLTAAAESNKIWEVVGGADKGGIVVREAADLNSPSFNARLETGCILQEIELVGERLHFRKLQGRGPEAGWVSIALKDKVLACRVASGSKLLDDLLHGVQQVDVPVDVDEPPLPASSPSGVEHLTQDAEEQQNILKQEAADAQEEGNLDLALDKLTAAISLGCASALLYCRRAQVLLDLRRPRAAIGDCSAALNVNPDSGKAFKIRARAHVMLKHWMEAHSDFQNGLAIDYDDGTYAESLVVAAKAKDMQTIATAKRVKDEVAEQKRKLAEEKVAQEAMVEQRKKEEAQKAKEEAQRALEEADAKKAASYTHVIL